MAHIAGSRTGWAVILAGLGSIFIPHPWLALVPAVVFHLVHRAGRQHLAGAAALTWLLYGLYECTLNRRWLCTGECNIRVDLLLVYPLLLLMSAAALVAAVVAFRWNRPTTDRV